MERNKAERRTTTDRRLPGYDGEEISSLGLSRRELAVLERVAEGHTNEQIARALGRSTLTVKKHLERMSAKLGASNRAALVAIAWQRRPDRDGAQGRSAQGRRPKG